jgi:hypothetical protein
MDGEPYLIYLSHENYEVCCDCHLSHLVKYEVLDKNGKPMKGVHLRITVWRAERKTAALRRAFKFQKDDE